MEPPPEHLLPNEGYRSWKGSFKWTMSLGIKTTITQYEITKLDGSILKLSFEKKEVVNQLPPSNAEHAIAEAQLKKAGVDVSVNRKIMQLASRDNYMKKVGDGQCYALGKDLLVGAGGKAPKGTEFGKEITPLKEMRPGLAGGVLPGDIVQFSWAKFNGHNTNKSAYYSMFAGDETSKGMHTAIVFYVSSDMNGNNGNPALVLLEQNVNGVLAINHREYKFADLKSGSYKIYRPVKA